MSKSKKKTKQISQPFGMTKREAEARISGDRYSWAELAKMLRDVAPIVRPVQARSSKISKGVPLAILFHMFQRTAKRLKGRPKGGEHESTAIDLLREFGVK